MSIEAASYKAQEFRRSSSFAKEIEKPKSHLRRQIDYLDSNWEDEGLSSDWHSLRGELGQEVGFSLKAQMDNLKANDGEGLEKWEKEASYAISGYVLEYLSGKIVYPCRYRLNPQNPEQMGDPDYGYTDIVDIVSSEERGGAVKEVAAKAKKFFLNEKTPEGSLFVFVSPAGESGLKTDKGEKIIYPDSHVFVLQKEGSGKDFEVTNYTLKTDFTHRECRELIFQLTGKVLSPTSPLEDYTRAVAMIRPEQEIRAAGDIVSVLQEVRAKPTVHKDKTWKQMKTEIAQKDKAYIFNSKVEELKQEFSRFCLENPNLSKLDYQKALVATILQISRTMLFETEDALSGYDYFARRVGFGEVIQEMAKIPGCAGGGSQSVGVETLGGTRLGLVENANCPEIKCPKCGWKPSVSELKQLESGSLTTCPGKKDGKTCGYKPG